MANKRMFSKDITDSDAFIEMSSAAQALYFHLNQGADDDGFNNQVQMAMMKAHASSDDLKILMAKNFVIRFECGVIVIKHWRLHNTLRKDRYTPTNYKEELNLLGIKENGVYTLGCQLVAERLPSGCPSIDKSSVVESSVVEESIEADEADDENQKTPVSCQTIVDLYHSICVSYPKIRSISNARRTAIKARLNTYSLDEFRAVFENAEASSFLKGKNERNWSATFDWLLTDRNMAKVLEGNYADRGTSRKEKGQQWSGHRELDDDEMAAIRQMLADDSSGSWEV